MFYSDDTIEEIRLKNDIVDVISGYVKLQRKGSSYFGLCPFHNEKSPSFSVSPGKQMYYCFGCGAGGNVFTFVMEYENYSFPEAVKFLADRVGVDLPEQEYNEEMKKQQDLKSRILDLNKMAANYFYFQLRQENGRLAMEYLNGRELSDETIKGFGLGYANKYSDDLYLYLKKKGISDELLSQSGLMNVDEKNGMYDKFWNRVIFPIMDVNGRVIGFGGRVMGDGKPKYLNSPETKVFDKSRNLYGLNIARTSRKKNLLVCEGYMDVISLHQAGYKNAVASLGTALTTQHASLLKRYTEEVVLTYDSDEAGMKAALRAIPTLKAAGLSAKVLDMKPYKDPDEFIKALGAEAFQDRIDHAVNSFFFEIDVLQKSYQMDDPESKTEFYNQVAKRLLEFEQELERENYIEAVAARYHVGFENLRKLVNRMAMKNISAPEVKQRSKNRNTEKEDGMLKSQKLLLTWLIENPGLFAQIKPYVGPDDFTTELYHTVAAMLFEQYESGALNPAKIINHFTDPEQQRETAALFNTSIRVETKEEMNKALKETIARVMNNSIEYKTTHLDPTDIVGLQQIIQAKRRLQDIEKVHISLD
ncbi:MAG: DNA primase [Clostridiales bacterium]|nr:DNA primase [Clostridiales bacterium]MDU3243173.1 DNA primase [Clostridiales bacterium]